MLKSNDKFFQAKIAQQSSVLYMNGLNGLKMEKWKKKNYKPVIRSHSQERERECPCCPLVDPIRTYKWFEAT